MGIDVNTRIHELLETYPHLKPWLMARADEFAKLDNPVVYNTVGRVATIEAAAKMADIDPAALLDEIKDLIARHAIVEEESSGSAPRLEEDERARRQEVLKGLIKELHDGASVDDVKERFDALVGDIDAAEVALMEQAIISEGMPVEEVQRLCDVHVTVFREALDEEPEPDAEEGHPIHMYLRENEVASELVAELREDLSELGEDDDVREDLDENLGKLLDIAIHYRRKENQLFPVLERHGVEGPTKVMWGLDDEIVAMLKNDRGLLRAADDETVRVSLDRTLTAVEDMIYKEEKILFPTALQVVTDEEWEELAAGDPDIGYAWIGGGAEVERRVPVSLEAVASGDALVLPLVTGGLTVEQIDLMMGVLPFDISFVDENDRVRFYSEGDRVFPRSPAVIGREVRNCHPPKSLDKVEEILTEFKAGTKDTAEFWIQAGDQFIHIRYFAMRDAQGAYRGCLEVVQNATHIRALEGQRRIVEW